MLRVKWTVKVEERPGQQARLTTIPTVYSPISTSPLYFSLSYSVPDSTDSLSTECHMRSGNHIAITIACLENHLYFSSNVVYVYVISQYFKLDIFAPKPHNINLNIETRDN